MSKLRSPERLILFVGLLVLVSFSSCARSSATKTQTSQTNSNNSKPTTPTNSKIAINRDPKGTTEDSSQLSDVLQNAFKQRREQFMFKPGTTEVETDVYLKAEPTIGIIEVLKMIDVVREAGSRNVLLPIEVSEAQATNLKPNPLTLMVTIGDVKPDFEKVIAHGVELIHGPTVPHADKNTLPKEFVAVFVPKDGDYLIGDKSIAQAELVNELKPPMKEPAAGKRLNLIIDQDGDVRYRSLAELAYAAHDAGATEIYIIMLKN